MTLTPTTHRLQNYEPRIKCTPCKASVRALTHCQSTKISAVYTDAAHYFLSQGTLVKILHLAGIGWNYAISEEDGDLVFPSWVPNWSQPPARAMLSSSNSNYETSTGYPHFMMQMYGDNTLNIGGYVVDEIEGHTSPFSPDGIDRNKMSLTNKRRRSLSRSFEILQRIGQNGHDDSEGSILVHFSTVT